MSDNKSPTHRAYVICPRKDDNGDPDDFWLNVGSVWTHKDGKGFSISLDAMPASEDRQYKLVLREVKEPPPEPPKKSYKK